MTTLGCYLSTLLQESFLLSHELLASLLIPSVYSPEYHPVFTELSRILFLVFFFTQFLSLGWTVSEF